MALLFSAVRATANDQEVEFFVGGIPREYDDLEGWTAFDRFMEDIDEETEVAIHAEAYLYGEEETHRATPEEVAYFMKRIEMDDTFLSRCDNIESVDFTINWSPEELFNMKFCIVPENLPLLKAYLGKENAPTGVDAKELHQRVFDEVYQIAKVR